MRKGQHQRPHVRRVRGQAIVAGRGHHANVTLKLYRVWHGDSNDRQEIGRISALSIEEAGEIVKKAYIKPSALKDMITEGDEGQIIFQWYGNEEEGDSGEYFEIDEFDNPKPSDRSFRTIYGTDEHYRLSGRKVKKNPDPYPAIAAYSRMGQIQKAVDESRRSGPMR